MSKKQILDLSGDPVVVTKTIKTARPVGSQVLVELLSAAEAIGTTLSIGNANVGAPQGYVVALGPKVKSEEWGFNVGDRVILSGSHTPLPEVPAQSQRVMGCVEPHCIKAVLTENV